MQHLLALIALMGIVSLWRLLLRKRIQRGARPNKKIRIVIAFLFFPILIIPSLLGLLIIGWFFIKCFRIDLLILGCLVEVLGVLLLKSFWKWLREGMKENIDLTV